MCKIINLFLLFCLRQETRLEWSSWLLPDPRERRPADLKQPFLFFPDVRLETRLECSIWLLPVVEYQNIVAFDPHIAQLIRSWGWSAFCYFGGNQFIFIYFRPTSSGRPRLPSGVLFLVLLVIYLLVALEISWSLDQPEIFSGWSTSYNTNHHFQNSMAVTCLHINLEISYTALMFLKF